MNFNRNLTPPASLTRNSADRDRKLASKIQKLAIVKRVYLYILLMTAIGAGMGEVKYHLESKNCMANDLCWTVEPAQRRIRELSLGAVAGMITATLISIPALLEED